MQNNALKKRFDYMTQTPVDRLICSLAVPTIISMMVTNLYNMADTFFVGKISTQATAAVGIVLSLMNFIQAIGFFCGHGSANYVSRKLGAGDLKSAQEMASTGFALAFILGSIILTAGILNLKALSIMLGHTGLYADNFIWYAVHDLAVSFKQSIKISRQCCLCDDRPCKRSGVKYFS